MSSIKYILPLLLIFSVTLADDSDPHSVAENATTVSSHKVKVLSPLSTRRDIFNHFKIYDGGFNPQSIRYWASLYFTGTWAFILSLICLVFAFTATKTLQSKKIQNKKIQKICLSLLAFFAILTIGGVFAVITGNVMMGAEFRRTKTFVYQNLNMFISKLQDTAKDITSISKSNDALSFVREDAVQRLDAARRLLYHLISKAVKTSSIILYSAQACLTVVGLLILVFTVFFTGTKRKKSLALWLGCIVSLSWFFAGFFFATTNMVGDICNATRECSNGVCNMSTMSKVIRLDGICYNSSSANIELSPGKDALKSYITKGNRVIDEINEKMKIYFKFKEIPSFVPIKHICDPFGEPPYYTLVKCSSNDTTLDTFMKDFLPYKCDNDNILKCVSKGKPIPLGVFESLTKALKFLSKCYQLMETLLDIMTCKPLNKVMREMYVQHCPKWIYSFNIIWMGFTLASIAMTLFHVLLQLFII